jgi:hypothetical protein
MLTFRTRRPSDKSGEKILLTYACKTIFTGVKPKSYSSSVQCCSDLGKAVRLEKVIARYLEVKLRMNW